MTLLLLWHLFLNRFLLLLLLLLLHYENVKIGNPKASIMKYRKLRPNLKGQYPEKSDS